MPKICKLKHRIDYNMAHSLNREMYAILVLRGVLGLPINSLRDILTQTNPCCHGNE